MGLLRRLFLTASVMLLLPSCTECWHQTLESSAHEGRGHRLSKHIDLDALIAETQGSRLATDTNVHARGWPNFYGAAKFDRAVFIWQRVAVPHEGVLLYESGGKTYVDFAQPDFKCGEAPDTYFIRQIIDVLPVSDALRREIARKVVSRTVRGPRPLYTTPF